jgi:exonuclease SbcD
VHQRGDLDLCCDFLAHVRGGNAASQRERALLATAVESSRLVRGEQEDQGRPTQARAAPHEAAITWL